MCWVYEIRRLEKVVQSEGHFLQEMCDSVVELSRALVVRQVNSTMRDEGEMPVSMRRRENDWWFSGGFDGHASTCEFFWFFSYALAKQNLCFFLFSNTFHYQLTTKLRNNNNNNKHSFINAICWNLISQVARFPHTHTHTHTHLVS